jgi:hypothetical protein
MTTTTRFTLCGDAAGTPRTGTGDDDLDTLPVDPFVALRAAHGMLLGENDFRVLMGNPRGKLMAHSSWLHGGGVIWGLDVDRDDRGRLRVRPGLAVDRIGRELRLEVSECLDLGTWAADWLDKHPPENDEDRVRAYVVAEFAGCPDRPVPALADPCDVNRRHDSPSRIVETIRISIVAEQPGGADPYHRLRVLLGLTPGDPKTDQDVLTALERVRRAQPQDRPAELLRQFRRMAARDATDRRPAPPPGGDDVPWFPVDEAVAGIVLARLTLRAGDTKGEKVEIVPEARAALLPTAVIQELVCGLASGVIGPREVSDAGGPRLVGVHWAGHRELVLRFDRRIARNSWEDRAITVSSLSDEGHGWRHEHIDTIRFRNDDHRLVVVRLDDAPAYPTVRIVIRGTGATPLFGREPFVPFAGRVGGPPGSRHEGHDVAVNTERYTARPESSPPESSPPESSPSQPESSPRPAEGSQ